MSELLPCPFCGSSAHIGMGSRNDWVFCDGCNCTHPFHSWNNRPIEKVNQELVEALEMVLESYEGSLIITDNEMDKIKQALDSARRVK